jgi:Ca-activated chloride channel family protein
MPFVSTCPDGRRGAAWLAVSLVNMLAVCSSGLLAQAPPGTFRSRTELVVLQVSVVDQQGRFVPDLTIEDFSVYEEGRPQEVMLFASASAPLDLMLLMDTSASMEGRIGFVQDAAVGLLHGLKPDDRASVVLFDGRVRVAHELSGDVASLEEAIRGASPGGATALYEAIYIGLRELARAAPEGGELRRQGLVVLSDGDDNQSRVMFDQVIEEARRRTATVFTILPSPVADVTFPGARTGSSTLFAMRQLAEETGGRAFTPAALADLAAVYGDIGGELNHQYWLAYAPTPDPAGGFRRVSVRMPAQSGLRARTRNGYYSSRPPPRPPAATGPGTKR